MGAHVGVLRLPTPDSPLANADVLAQASSEQPPAKLQTRVGRTLNGQQTAAADAHAGLSPTQAAAGSRQHQPRQVGHSPGERGIFWLFWDLHARHLQPHLSCIA